MEISGQLADPSNENSNLYCHRCHRDGLKEIAYGYCQDCEEHLCESCYKHHRKPKPTRNHVLLDKDTMPQQPKSGNVSSDEITDVCPKHSDDLLEFFCNKYSSTACNVCVTLEHKHCNVDYIPEVSGKVSDEFKGLVERMEKLIEKSKSDVRISENAIINLEQIHKKVIEDIKLFRIEINERLDKMENEINRESKHHAHTAKCKHEKVKTESLHIVEEMSCSLTLLNSLNDEKKNNKLFIEMKNVGPRLARISDKQIQTVKDNKTDCNFSFIRNGKILDQLKSENSLGSISTYKNPSENSAVGVQYEGTVNVKSSSDKEICNVVGMVMISNSKMIVADCDNKKIKMIDVDNDTLISEITVSTPPQDIIKLPQNKLAIALANEKCIQIISIIGTRLSLDCRIPVGELCYCVAYCKGKLVVGCGNKLGKLVILDLIGNIIHVFDTPWLFRVPEKIIISTDEEYLYVSDCSHVSNNRNYFNGNDVRSSRCIKMDWKGNILHRFEQIGYGRPMGIQELEDGTLFVCYNRSNNIVRLSSSLNRCEIVGLEKAFITEPMALVYSKIDHKLYISLFRRCDFIKIFNIKWM